jgi:hypothetical protein
MYTFEQPLPPVWLPQKAGLCDVIHSFFHYILLGFSRSYARLADLADS